MFSRPLCYFFLIITNYYLDRKKVTSTICHYFSFVDTELGKPWQVLVHLSFLTDYPIKGLRIQKPNSEDKKQYISCLISPWVVEGWFLNNLYLFFPWEFISKKNTFQPGLFMVDTVRMGNLQEKLLYVVWDKVPLGSQGWETRVVPLAMFLQLTSFYWVLTVPNTKRLGLCPWEIP